MNCKGELYHCQQDEMGKAGNEEEVEIVSVEILTAQLTSTCCRHCAVEIDDFGLYIIS